MDKVSAVMPIKDRFDLAYPALLSILNQTSTISELIVIDDHSTSSAEDHFLKIKEIAESQGVSVKFHRNTTNKGVSSARNFGFHLATGDIICFCDSDDFWSPYKIEHVRDVFKDKRVNVMYHAFNWKFGSLKIFKHLPKSRLIRVPRFLLVISSFLNPSCLSIRRNAFGDGFNEDMRHHEDLDFALRLSLTNRIFFFNFPLMSMGRAPGTAGGATENHIAMRAGAIEALDHLEGNYFLRQLAFLKKQYHKIQARRMR